MKVGDLSPSQRTLRVEILEKLKSFLNPKPRVFRVSRSYRADEPIHGVSLPLLMQLS
jgi:hypothetical protein